MGFCFLYVILPSMVKTILGFDASSTTIGYCVLSLDESANAISFVKSGYIKPLKKGSIIERIVDTRNKVQKVIVDAQPDYIAIEEIIQFMKGKSTAKTIIMLTTFNRMICLTSYDYLGKEPTLYSVMTIRHGLKTGTDLPKKEEMPDLVSQHLGITFPYEYNKKGKLKVESYDKADGIAVALYHTFALSGRVKSKTKKAKAKPKGKSKSKKI
jgi:Holliday junction resolvasome RuvABC endonuclease subunit